MQPARLPTVTDEKGIAPKAGACQNEKRRVRCNGASDVRTDAGLQSFKPDAKCQSARLIVQPNPGAD